jgi:hypothetical protein
MLSPTPPMPRQPSPRPSVRPAGKQWAKRQIAAYRMAAPFAVFAVAVLLYLPGDRLFVATAVAQQQRDHVPTASSAVDKFLVVSQEWHRYPGLAVADITFNNGNEYAVQHAIISCDFLDPNGNVIATHHTTIFLGFPPGRTKINGVSFSLREKNATPGSCRVLSVRTEAAPN